MLYLEQTAHKLRVNEAFNSTGSSNQQDINMKRIVHLGLGNFHRAHQAWYTSTVGDWKITGVVMTNAALKAEMAEHNNDYILGTWGNDGLSAEKISVYDEVLLATEQSSSIISKIADTDTHVVTLTITEKGYHLRSSDNHLDLNAEPISHDLKSDKPKSAVGLLATGLMRRCLNNGQPLTVLSCDNLSNNGDKLRQAMHDYISVLALETVPILKEKISFPNSMVDRITPTLSSEVQKNIRMVAGLQGIPCVGTESFSEWVIEDKFIAPRPQWDKAGAVLVSDVASFEERKLRLLNAAHSYLAYAGLLAGYTFVHEAINDPVLRANVNGLWDEAAVTVSEPAAATLSTYRTALLNRFSVVEMQHRLDQVASDGSLKLRERLLPILKHRQFIGIESPVTMLAISTWAEFVQSGIANNESLNDPERKKINEIVTDESSDATDLLVAHIIGNIS